MKKSLILSSILAATACPAIALAGFTITTKRTQLVAPGLDRIDLFALNTGGGTGTQIKTVSINFASTNGKKVYFNVEDKTVDENGEPAPDGIPDTVDLPNATNVPNKSSIRINTTAANNTYVGVSPTAGLAQPNPWVGGVRSFTVSVANLGTTQASTGIGFRFARLFVDAGAFGSLSGQVGGDIGGPVAWGPPCFRCTPSPPTVTITAPKLRIDVSPPGLESASAVVSAQSTQTIASLSLVGAVPATLVDNLQITGPVAGPKSVTLSNLTPADVGSYALSFEAFDTFGQRGTQTLTIDIVIPEPALLSVLLPMFVLRRRR